MFARLRLSLEKKALSKGVGEVFDPRQREPRPTVLKTSGQEGGLAAAALLPPEQLSERTHDLPRSALW
jgi:hypothetical protein